MRRFAIALLCAGITAAATLPADEHIRGAALHRGKLYTWGDRLRVWKLPNLASNSLAAGRFSEGGCIADLDNDGKPEFVSQEGTGLGALTLRRSPFWQPEPIDQEVESHDCTQATLFGRRGILMVQRYMQVRFYEPPARAGQPWPYREIYSFYTNSKQTGLLVRDIDGDSLPDILCGNYWIRSPARFDLPWRLYAINTHHETPEAAMSRFAILPGNRVAVAQGHMQQTNVRIFERLPDPHQLWKETTLPFDFVQPHGIAVHRGKLYVGENQGAASRLVRFDPKAKILRVGQDCLELLESNGSLILVGTNRVQIQR